jgi:hypothetical protein
MLRLPLVAAVAVTLLLTSCSAPSPDPAEPLPEGSTLPSAAASDEPDPVAESPYEPCADADTTALHGLYPGDGHPEPTGDYYPDAVPLPSCVFEDADFGQATAFFIPATETDFETLEAAIVAEQGTGIPSDGEGLTTAGETWDGQPIQGIYLVPASFGVTLDYIAIRFEFP